MTADLSALIARLEAAEVGSRELDASVAKAFGAKDTVAYGDPALGNYYTAPAYFAPVTTSLDAALALADRVLPDATHWEVCTPNSYEFSGPYAATISDPRWLDVSRDDWESFTHGEASGNTPALALCIAILLAKQGEG